MANYKGIGFDTTNAKNRTGLSSDAVQFTPQLDALNGAAVTGDLSVSADCSISGDLDVAGDIISRGAVNLVVEDNFIDLNFGNTTVTAESGGLTISMNRTSGFTSSTVTTFVAGIASTSNPTFTNTDATGSSLLAVADIVMITGADEQGNNGLYQVSAVSGASFPQTVTINGVGTVGVDGSLPFCQTQFEAETGATAVACKIDLAVWAVADGTNNFLDAAGANYAKGTFLTAYATSAVLSDFDGAGDYVVASSTLQSAYDGGATIITASSTDIAYTLTSGDFTAAGTGGVLLTPTAASSFTSGGALTLTGGGASSWSTTAGALTIDCKADALTLDGNSGVNIAGNAAEIDITTTGAVDINGAALSLDGTDSTNLTMTANAVGAKVLTILATNAGGGEGQASITATDQMTIGDGTGTLKFDAGVVTDAGVVSYTLDPSGAVAITGGSTADFSSTSGSAVSIGDGVLTLSATSGALSESGLTTCDLSGTGTMNITGGGVSTFGDDTAVWSFDGAGALTETGMVSATITPSAAITLTAGAASVWSTSSGALTLTSALAATWSTAAGALTLDGAGGVNIAGNDAEIDLTTTAALDLNSGAGTWDASTLTQVSSDDLTLEMSANVASAKTLKIKASNADGGGSAIMTLDAPEISLSASLVGQFSAFAGKSHAAFAKGDLLYIIATTGRIMTADADGIASSRIVGVAAKAASAAGESIPVINYGIVSVVADATVATSLMGSPCYVSLTAGKVTMTPPTATADVVYQVGIVTLSDGSTAVDVLLQPQFILENG